MSFDSGRLLAHLRVIPIFKVALLPNAAETSPIIQWGFTQFSSSNASLGIEKLT
jgi:hypothetical protein